MTGEEINASYLIFVDDPGNGSRDGLPERFVNDCDKNRQTGGEKTGRRISKKIFNRLGFESALNISANVLIFSS